MTVYESCLDSVLVTPPHSPYAATLLMIQRNRWFNDDENLSQSPLIFTLQQKLTPS